MSNKKTNTRAQRIISLFPKIMASIMMFHQEHMIFKKNGKSGGSNIKSCGDNMTFNQYLALMIIHELKECSVNELSHKMNIAQSTASQLVDRLVKAGLVHRDIHSKDRRRMVVNLSKNGKIMTEKCTEFLKQTYGKIISVLDETEQRMLQDGFEKLHYVAMKLDSKVRITAKPQR
jgi:MarR family transcriptional regulator, organic hydroperoxide resistance regulator